MFPGLVFLMFNVSTQISDMNSYDAKLITAQIASVKLNKCGIPVRTFVDLQENKV